MMASLASLQWLVACASCLAAGMLVWLMLDGAARLRPALRTRRDVWLAAQCVVAFTAVIPFLPLPRSAHMNIAPQITLTAAQPAPARAAGASTASPSLPQTAAFDNGDGETAASSSAAATAALQILPSLAALWLLTYAAGLAWAIAKLLRARRLWRGLLASAERLSPQELLVLCTADQLREIAQRGLTVLRTDAAISPMLIGVRRPRLLLPAHLDTLCRQQQQMIIAHELHHWRVRDPLCLAIAAILQTIFWFNPALRWMAKQMAWALELSCDQHVLAGRPQQQRKQYAAALLRQWTTITPAGAAAFGGATISARIRHMQQEGLPALGTATTWLVAAGLASILALGAMLQPALAFTAATSEAAASYSSTSIDTATASPEIWRAPVDKVRVTSFFGVIRSVLPTPHRGIDFGAAKGTPVHATADGTVIAAGPFAENDGRYGNVVIIDHGGQQSLYAHLDSVSVTPGQRVQAGQHIGAVGQTGFATGPHLHLELRENGRILDPAPKFANLDAYATARALKVRRQQKG
ncbi:peptidoglycan DD-metalloendopeptidase family protein [Duganella sp. FT135W]|uniref:Peptidoglycan DD-metalloendopeptidase family protein n=1 Tax=Duganella flavida TaxID=2692175 RepID=A0A6L8KGP2_9BURK|nr:M56 family metallopeptidase [Duganella flavida]MYM25014.1 peptidoglycan DD-metalloendopeptidase family protein [Duganella flavida]